MADNFFGITDTGKLRDNNEDTFLAQKLSNGWIVVSAIDGVGGYEGGEVAAAIAREVILKKLLTPFTDATQALKEAVWEANLSIYTEKQKNGSNSSMACVLTVALADIENNQFYYAHVGDTRMYLLRDGSLVKVTKDHSFVGFLEDSGRLSEHEAMKHPKRNEINKALGFDGSIGLDSDYIETGSSPFLPGDVLLLCSDGLTDMVNNKDITAILLSNTALLQKGEALINAANSAGGKDNITAVMVTNNKKPSKQKATKPAPLIKKNESNKEVITSAVPGLYKEEGVVVKKRKNTFVVPLLSILCLLLAATAYWFWTKSKELGNPVGAEVAKTPNEGERKFSDSIVVAQKIFIASDSLFGSRITVSDTIFIRQDSLHLIGNGLNLQRDSSYTGPAFFVTANNKYLLLENITFKDFTTAIATQSKGVELKNVVFQNSTVPVQQNILLPLNDTLSGILRDSFYTKKDSTRK
ncbi:MAG TPA: protein phosphatase 2C domain-containing protein [Flavisolibacter sp.]|jgi:serine/threonine protein phosphatase PrpC|nr:protein phosphatase 2C domain-containing protein [Flavisolibacter sp.]